MAEFFLELFSEEIPARMQRDAADALRDICSWVFRNLSPQDVKTFYGPRRLAISLEIAMTKPGGVAESRGPRDSAPEAALAGFLGKHAASRHELITEGGYFWLRRDLSPTRAADIIMGSLADALAKFPWPKSMRWGQGENFTWVRPLRRIVCLLDGQVVPLKLGPITASDITEGHRVHAPGTFKVSSASDWEKKLLAHYVIADVARRVGKIGDGGRTDLDELGLELVQDANLLYEVAGLVEWPVRLFGKIDPEFMDLPPEVRELSMKINQKYFALRDASGNPAPTFMFVANLQAPDAGAAIITGNERVLRARLSDARHFWDQDRKTPLEKLLPKLEKITFHGKIGTQRERVERIANKAENITSLLGLMGEAGRDARTAGLLCKADLVTHMVGEFPELQGVMGGYYASMTHGKLVGDAIKTHYQPKGPSDSVPKGNVAVSVALADKLDTLIEFFKIGETPTGSGDPFALRRAALGVIRIILENDLRLALKPLLDHDEKLFAFIMDRLRVKLRAEGRRFDVLDAVLSAGADDDLVRVMKRVDAVTEFLQTEDGANLLAAYKRAANILRIEDAKDGPHKPEFVLGPLPMKEAEELRDMLVFIERETYDNFTEEKYALVMAAFAKLRTVLDAFFERVTVNTPEPDLRRKNLQLLARFQYSLSRIADFSKIEG